MNPTSALADGRLTSHALRLARLRRRYGLSPELASLIAVLAWGTHE